jgi:hypothetical protein
MVLTLHKLVAVAVLAFLVAICYQLNKATA